VRKFWCISTCTSTRTFDCLFVPCKYCAANMYLLGLIFMRRAKYFLYSSGSGLVHGVLLLVNTLFILLWSFWIPVLLYWYSIYFWFYFKMNPAHVHVSNRNIIFVPLTKHALYYIHNDCYSLICLLFIFYINIFLNSDWPRTRILHLLVT
jgi:hypothetical protein